MMPIFTLEELNQFNLAQLRRLAIYFNVDVELSKRRLIEQIYKKIEMEEEGNEPPASIRVQVRRIRESLKEN